MSRELQTEHDLAYLVVIQCGESRRGNAGHLQTDFRRGPLRDDGIIYEWVPRQNGNKCRSMHILGPHGHAGVF